MITISFVCKESNHVLLLTALYDILTVEELDGSIAAIDFGAWLIDEIGARLYEIDQFDVGDEEHRLSGAALEVAKIYSPDEKN